MQKQTLKNNPFFANILLPTALLAVYCASFAYLSSKTLPVGVNNGFANEFQKYLLLFLGFLLFLFVALFRKDKPGRLAFSTAAEKIVPADLFLLLLPLTPVVQYIINNRNVLSPVDMFLVLAFFILFSCIYVFAVPLILAKYTPTRIVMLAGLAFVFTITSMASLSNTFTWFRSGSFKIQLLFFAGTLFICWLFSRLADKRILYLLIAVSIAANTGTQLLSHRGDAVSSTRTSSGKLQSILNDRKPVVTPNIYLLVYDAYVSSETMLGYGIDNTAQEEFLRAQGFVLYPHTYSVGGTTLESMSRVLSISNQPSRIPRTEVSGNGLVQNTLKRLGYSTYGIFPYDFMFRGVGSSYDGSVPEKNPTPSYVYLISAVLIGEFQFDLGFDNQNHDQYVASKQRIFEAVPNYPMFLYTHSNLPEHSQNSGACLANETDLFKQRLSNANTEMRQDVAAIISSDPGAVIIVAGDHGPYLTKNCFNTAAAYDISEITRLDIQDRFGTFLAVRWPSADYEKFDDITVLQDIFPAVFAYLYNDPAILQAKIDPDITNSNKISGASVLNGIIQGGQNDGEPLYQSGK